MFNSENAMVIFNQMGGRNRLNAMIGAYNFAFSSKDNYADFRFKLCKKYNYFRVKLNDLDLYDVTFMKIGKNDIKARHTIENIYADMLNEVFESETGLRLSL